VVVRFRRKERALAGPSVGKDDSEVELQPFPNALANC
jgi:hypothetical protein